MEKKSEKGVLISFLAPGARNPHYATAYTPIQIHYDITFILIKLKTTRNHQLANISNILISHSVLMVKPSVFIF